MGKILFITLFDPQKNAKLLQEEMSSDGACFHYLFGLFLTWVSTIRCVRTYFCYCLIFRVVQRHLEKYISSDGPYLHALFWVIDCMGYHN